MKSIAPFAALPLALTLAACSDSNETASEAGATEEDVAISGATAEDETGALVLNEGESPPSSARQMARIPPQFRGTFARSASDCAIRNHDRFTVTDKAVSFFEDGGQATDIRRNGDALAVTYTQQRPDDTTRPSAVYFALEDQGGAMSVKMGDREAVRYTRCTGNRSPDSQASRTEQQQVVPEKFRGLYALDRKACAEDYTYQPAFQNVTVEARDVSFFETGGPVTDVEVDGDAIAITLREMIGDGEFTRAIYFRLNDDGTARYRPGRDEAVENYVRCN